MSACQLCSLAWTLSNWDKRFQINSRGHQFFYPFFSLYFPLKSSNITPSSTLAIGANLWYNTRVSQLKIYKERHKQMHRYRLTGSKATRRSPHFDFLTLCQHRQDRCALDSDQTPSPRSSHPDGTYYLLISAAIVFALIVGAVYQCLKH